MSTYYGDFSIGRTVRCRFNTNDATGAPATLVSGTVAISKDGADVAPSGGVTLLIDVGSVVGRNAVVIDMGQDGATFAAGSEYSARLATGTSGGVSLVGVGVGDWSVQNRHSAYTGGPVASVATPVTVGTNNDKAGYALSSAGLDSVSTEVGLNARQALALMLDTLMAKLSGVPASGVGTVTIRDVNDTADRVVVGVDGTGNRTSLILNPPA